MIGLLFKIMYLGCVIVTTFMAFGVVLRFYATGRWDMLLFGFIAVVFLVSLLFNSVVTLFPQGN